MAIIVENTETSRTYILLGSGYGLYQSKKPHMLFGNLMAETETGDMQLISACDEYGKIVWLDSAKVRIVSIDGKSPLEYY